MKEHPEIARYAGLLGSPTTGTPAGNSPFTQEQMAVMADLGLSIEDVETKDVMVAVRDIASPFEAAPRICTGEAIPIREASPIRSVRCPVFDYRPGYVGVVMPDGKLQPIRTAGVGPSSSRSR